ncbi:hypothetical protein M9H77_32260 [Catharanthus roseus]|uniref:Uncharacterized protein n=1 Tax=Catharanthus roseus TaxID=4058 RepID=A0ACC0A6N4_CATRO|nr:hypothetical protein M9H77_32260 [Catharanthus roseus]
MSTLASASIPPGSSTPASAFIPPGTSTLTSASIPPRTSTSSATTSTPSTTLTLFPQLPYSSLVPISTPSSSSSAVETSSRPAPSSSACPLVLPVQSAIDSHILILPTADSFNKQLSCAKSITKIIKEHFVENHASFGKIPDRIKKICIQSSRKDIDGTRRMSVPYGMLGINESHYVKYQELKTNTEWLHIETGSPMPTDEQLMFEAVGSNKGHVYDFSSQSVAITAK